MNIKNIDKWACAKAVGVLMLSWLAFPILYHMFKKEKKEEVENDGKEQPEQTMSKVL